MEKRKNIPELRFPGFEGEWERNKLGDLTNVTAGGTPSTLKGEYWNGTIRWMNSGELNLKRVFEVENRITEQGLRNSSTKLIPKYCILIGLAGQGKTRGTVAMNMMELCTNQSIASVFPNDNLFNSDFLYHNLDNRYDELRNLSTGDGGRGGLNLQILKSLKVNLPTLPEQQKIATFFTAIDQKISQLKKKKDLLEQYKKGVMQLIFSQQIRFKDDDGREFPKWEKKRLGEIGITFNGLSGKSSDDFGQGIPYIQYKQIFDSSRIDISKFGYVDIKPNEKQKKVNFGDVFFTVSSETPNEVGMASVLLDKVDELYLNSFCFGYRASLNALNPYFSRYLFRSALFRRDIVKLAQGSTRYNMSKAEFMKLEALIPSLPEQTKIANFLSAIDDKIHYTHKQIEQAEQWKKGLVQQMFI